MAGFRIFLSFEVIFDQKQANLDINGSFLTKKIRKPGRLDFLKNGH